MIWFGVVRSASVTCSAARASPYDRILWSSIISWSCCFRGRANAGCRRVVARRRFVLVRAEFIRTNDKEDNRCDDELEMRHGAEVSEVTARNSRSATSIQYTMPLHEAARHAWFPFLDVKQCSALRDYSKKGRQRKWGNAMAGISQTNRSVANGERINNLHYLQVQAVFLVFGALLAAIATWVFGWPYAYGLGYTLGTFTGICFWRFQAQKARRDEPISQPRSVSIALVADVFALSERRQRFPH